MKLGALCITIVIIIMEVASAQVAVETGILTGTKAGAISGFAGLGASVSATAARLQSIFQGGVSRHAAPSLISLNATVRSCQRNFVPTVSGNYFLGVDWGNPSVTPVTLRAGGEELHGTAEGPVLLRFTPEVRRPCAIGLETQGDLPPAGLLADLQVVREPAPGEPQLKSLLTPDQRLSSWTRRGPQASLLPLAANLTERSLANVAAPTDLDRLFATALQAVPGVTTEDLRALVHLYDDLSDEAKTATYTTECRALRAATPTHDQVPAKLLQPAERPNQPAATSGGEPGNYQVTLRRLECVDESNPEWWGSDNVAMLWTLVADDQTATGGSAVYEGFDDGVQHDLTAADQSTGRESWHVTQGLGLVVELWEWESVVPERGLRPWAISESLGGMLVKASPDHANPKPMDRVSRELTVAADLIGQGRLHWSAGELAALIAPGQTVTQVVDLRLGSDSLEYDPAGYYRLVLEVERLQ